MRLSSTLLTVSPCCPYDAVIFRTVFCVSQWAVCFCHLPHFGLMVAEVFIDVDLIAAVFIDYYLSTLVFLFALTLFQCQLRRNLSCVTVLIVSVVFVDIFTESL